ncbi:MAG: cell division protein FtsZ [Zoogloeaceae bacterium]|jgi:cell division protein FtsZ|nr:cell division protein FtsZ [Zoogloeaceae bacterium]
MFHLTQECFTMQFDSIDKDSAAAGTIIKVIGVGGAGGNAIRHMVQEGVMGVDFIVANTDAQVLNSNPASIKISLGKLGAGGKPEAGKAAAEANREAIREQISGAHMVFIAAGMGGGTGTGAAPVIAEIAKEMGILTVGVVSRPFELEGQRRMNNAERGITELNQHVNSLIVIQNEKLLEVMGEEATQKAAYCMADDVLKNAVGGIVEIITREGIVNVDFEDVRTVMSETGRAMMGSYTAVGADRASIATEQALASPLLEGVELTNAKGVVVNITGHSDSLRMVEVKNILARVKACASDDAHIIYGAVYDDNMGDELRVTVVATGLGNNTMTIVPDPEPIGDELQQQGTGTHDSVIRDPSVLTALERKRLGQGNGVARSMRSGMAQGASSAGVIPAFLRRQAD